MVVGNEKEGNGVGGASDFVFCALGWSVVDGGFGPAKRLPVFV